MTHVGIKQISMNGIQRFTTVTNEQPATTQIALTFVGAMEAGLGMVDIVQVMCAYRLLLRVHVRSDRTYRGNEFSISLKFCRKATIRKKICYEKRDFSRRLRSPPYQHAPPKPDFPMRRPVTIS